MRTDKKFLGDKKYAYIYCLNTKIRLTMLCLSGFELYSRWVPLRNVAKRVLHLQNCRFANLNLFCLTLSLQSPSSSSLRISTEAVSLNWITFAPVRNPYPIAASVHT